MNIIWKNGAVPSSEEFDDIYYNPDNGLEESLHVFVKGSGLPETFNDAQETVIAELGFGTGLNFFLTWALFDQVNRAGDKKLHFISVEKYPLTKDDIQKALMPWAEKWGARLDLFLNEYPEIDSENLKSLRKQGSSSNKLDACFPTTPRLRRTSHRHFDDKKWHVPLSDTVSLTVYFDDVHTALDCIQNSVDIWYLDGFAPAKNPEMWTDDIFAHMARLSRKGSCFATFTAAGFVKRGLKAAGFDVRKTPGYGRKRERLVGVYKGGTP